MRMFAKLTWIELKLFAREPFAVIFTFAFPLIVLVVLTGSFQPDDVAFGGARPSDYYLASYVGVVIAAVGLIAVPVHVATYWERGILRRFRASSISPWMTVGAQIVVGLLMAVVGGVALMSVGRLVYDAKFPDAPWLALLGFVVSAFAFLGFGVLLGVITRNARAAQALGMLLFFPMWLLGGAGPPPDVMSSGMRAISGVLPLTFVVRSLQDPWLGKGLDWIYPMLLVALLVVSLAIAMRTIRTA